MLRFNIRTTHIATTEPPVNTLYYGDSLHILCDEAVADGTYDSGWWGRSLSRCQLITIEELLDGKESDLAPMQATFKHAQSIRKASQHQLATLPGLE